MIRKTMYKQGFSLVEVVIGVSILALAFLALAGTFNIYVGRAISNSHAVKAAFLSEEGVEAVKILRDGGWAGKIATLTPGQTYYLSWNGLNWVSSVTPEVIDDGFYRSFKLDSVYRDSNQDIASSGTLDNNTKKLSVTVAWPANGATSTDLLVTYITNLFAN